MASSHQLLDDAIGVLKQHPDWTHNHLATDLQARHGLTPNKAKTIARRVWSIVDQEACIWRIHRPKRKYLPGDSSGVFDNVVRALEEATLE